MKAMVHGCMNHGGSAETHGRTAAWRKKTGVHGCMEPAEVHGCTDACMKAEAHGCMDPAGGWMHGPDAWMDAEVRGCMDPAEVQGCTDAWRMKAEVHRCQDPAEVHGRKKAGGAWMVRQADGCADEHAATQRCVDGRAHAWMQSAHVHKGCADASGAQMQECSNACREHEEGREGEEKGA